MKLIHNVNLNVPTTTGNSEIFLDKNTEIKEDYSVAKHVYGTKYHISRLIKHTQDITLTSTKTKKGSCMLYHSTARRKASELSSFIY